MSCLSPSEAWQDLQTTTKTGKHPIIFSRSQLEPADYFFRPDPDTGDSTFVSARYRPLSLPCGKCLLCRKARAWEITVRALLERQAHPHEPSCFITLTVSDDHLPHVFPAGILRHKPFQDFAKRLRKRVGSFRYLMCGEYGETTKRPHYHVCLFGVDLTDRTWSSSDGTFCDSPLLSDIWGFGQIQCRPINDNAIAYVAGYELKLDGDDLSSADPDFVGPLLPSRRNYVKWSRRPGLGYDFMVKYRLFRHNVGRCDDGAPLVGFSPSVIYRGKQIFFNGRYFKRLLERSHDEWSSYDDLFKAPPKTPLQWSKDYDILVSVNDGRAIKDHLHSTPYASAIRAGQLKNRADLIGLKLATKRRDCGQPQMTHKARSVNKE